MSISKLLFVMALFGLTACQSGLEESLYQNEKPFQTSSGIRIISGKVEGWNLGVQKIATQFTNTAGSKPIGSGSIDADGQFRLDLPTVIADADLSSAVACSDLVVTPGSRVGIIPGIGVISETGKVLGLIVYSNTSFSVTGSTPVAGQTSTGWMYTNKNTVARGSCSGSQATAFTYDIDLQPGWNSVLSEVTTASNFTLHTGQTSAKLSWRFTAY
jgi:hypothetical protein